ncbi:hypothetical protein WJX73_003760 [Symbiochloris irregularis]|uniref:Uncharacterized protein n=1 Tax=Symbiochloris irregularis TaxID=706552 RepID=A0AAW1NX91_9CHLO
MALDVEEGKGEAQDSSKGKHRCFAGCSRLLNTITALCSLLCIVACGLAIAVDPEDRNLHSLIEQALRLWGIFFGVVILLVETEWEWFLASARHFDSWIWRGAFLAFESLLTLEITNVAGSSELHKSLRLYRIVAAVSLLCCSGLYVLGGILCFGRRKQVRRHARRETERQKVQENLLALERQREELKGLLAVYSND